MGPPSARTTIGWREWVDLPQFGLHGVKAKIDTGARSSSLHAFDVETLDSGGHTRIRFNAHPIQKNDAVVVAVECDLLEYREVRSSNGQTEQRPVVITDVEVMGQRWSIELTLANRDNMGFRMLLGREALRGRFTVDPGHSYYSGTSKRRRRPHRGRDA